MASQRSPMAQARHDVRMLGTLLIMLAAVSVAANLAYAADIRKSLSHEAISAAVTDLQKHVTEEPQKGTQPQPLTAAEQYRNNTYRILFVVGVLSLAVYSAVALGGLRLRAFEDRDTGVAACILAMVPLSPAVILGFPLGILGLLILNRPASRELLRPPSRHCYTVYSPQMQPVTVSDSQ